MILDSTKLCLGPSLLYPQVSASDMLRTKYLKVFFSRFGMNPAHLNSAVLLQNSFSYPELYRLPPPDTNKSSLKIENILLRL